ncbi:hypothetical protein PBY51_011481 [Eleginops maclovinus]|uniref:triacylglycerol lipase n=1 Tax=Eleginops maclovinus TaxID=56733 RepID=A0AAN8ATT1_ELEMC|nr:hypothetical protein PBY51_011481 [Eleginops maclovinus]
MLDFEEDWSISFAGCGFMGIYYVGASSCLLEHYPRFILHSSKIYGASAGALMAAVLAIGSPIEKCCAQLMFMAKECRKHQLGPLHPAFNLVQIVRDSLEGSLPEDAHLRASGKLCVSLTRVSDGKNVLVSEFDSREEVIQALVCSCFVPLYCGVIPPTYRGVHYVDGAASDNLPQCHMKNTITISAFAGESDLCPRGSPFNIHEVRFNNVSFQLNSENIYRLKSTFFPPQPEVMAEICHNGYIDALRFLQENNVISNSCSLRSLLTDAPKPACCELRVKEPAEDEEGRQQIGLKPPQEEQCWLDPQLVENLPVNVRKVLREACRETHAAAGLLYHMTDYLPKKVTSYLQIPCIPVESACSLAQRLVDWIPDVPRDMSWLYGLAGDIYKQTWVDRVKNDDRESSLHRCTSLPQRLILNQRKEDKNIAPPSSSLTLPWIPHGESDHLPLTPPATPTGFDISATVSPKSSGSRWGLGRAVGWIRNIASEQTSNLQKIQGDSVPIM